MKKLLSISIALALVLSFGLVATTPVAAAPANWYVVEGGGVAEDGTSWGDAFATIQEAVDAAGTGDTIMVEAGTYQEDLLIDQSVTLLAGC